MQSLEILKALALNINREKYPSLPERARAIHRYSDKTANELTRSIIDWLRFNNHYATRISSTGSYRNGKGWVKGNTSLGVSDIHAVIDGIHASIEIKIGRDKLSEHQIKTREAVEAAGGIYFVAKDFDSFFDWYQATIAKKKGVTP